MENEGCTESCRVRILNLECCIDSLNSTIRGINSDNADLILLVEKQKAIIYLQREELNRLQTAELERV